MYYVLFWLLASAKGHSVPSMISQMDSLAKRDDLCNDVCIELISRHTVLFDLFSVTCNLALPGTKQEATIDPCISLVEKKKLVN